MSSGGSLKQHSVANGDTNCKRKALSDLEECKRQHRAVPSLRLHKHPFLTLYYALMESVYMFVQFIGYVLSHKRIMIILCICACSLFSVNMIEGAHQRFIWDVWRKVRWWAWWIFLGFLSSCGFGSGLHTFVLYLGPFIAKVTMAAYECGSTAFPEPPYPDEFLCPENSIKRAIGTLGVVQKVLLESVMWGFGTAVGELPPYFMARAAALGGSISKEHQSDDADESVWHRRAQLWVQTIVQRVGFVGIMLCASVPNPLFDLAGMTCGHFLVPFSTFFGATVIGKAVNKMAIQMVFVVLIFSQDKVVWFQSQIRNIPRYGESMNNLIDEFLTQQKEKIHKSIVIEKQNWLQFIFGYIQLIIILGFVISIVHSLADNYATRLRKWQSNYNQCIENSKVIKKNH